MSLTDGVAVVSLLFNVVIMVLQSQMKVAFSEMNAKLAQLETKIYREFVTKEDAPRLIPLRGRGHRENP